jgi:NTE family protein
LLLSGGGARGAYQAGVLLGIARILGGQPGPFPFPILTGMSAGAINAAGLASGAPDFPRAAQHMAALWRNLEMDQVFRTDFLSLARIGLGWLRNLILGGVLGHHRFNALLDPEPLRGLLGRTLDFEAMRRAIRAGSLQGLAVLATHYGCGASVAFVESSRDDVTWVRARRLGVRTTLTIDHIMASTAIPIVFPAVPIDGTYYGDGAIRLSSPFSPAIHLGAARILAIGVRKAQPANCFEAALHEPSPRPTAAAIAGSVLNAIFMDAIDGDLERLARINTTLSLIPPEAAAQSLTKLRPVRALLILPSRDLADMARPHLRYFPAKIRYMLRGLGADQPENPDFLSYILFDRRYCRELVELGMQDAMSQRSAIEDFLAGDGDEAEAPGILLQNLSSEKAS